VDEYLPGGHLLTIDAMRRFKQIADWYPTASNITWLVSSLFAPVNTAMRYLTVQAGIRTPWEQVQGNILVWFFTAYVQRLGTYLIELNSGRLRVGMDRYLALQKAHTSPKPAPANSAQAARETPSQADGAADAPTVTLALVGQTKAGKSSLINALLGEQRALAHVVEPTPEVTTYDLQPPEISSRLRLLDTVGYGRSGLTATEKRVTENAARQADLILLVLHALNPGRQADLDFLKGLDEFYQARPDVRKPPIVAVLTHIDLLSPSLEWSPPYNWQEPTRPKERHIDAAVDEVCHQLGAFLTGVVPVCGSADKVYGVTEWLLPVLVELLGQAHAVAFLRCLKAEKDTGKVRKVFAQLLAVARGLGKILLQPAPKR
jgi:predicted GTPase